MTTHALMSDQEINELVARKLGIEKPECAESGWPLDYCNDINAAFEIVKKIGKQSQVHMSYEFYLKPKNRVTVYCDGGGGTYKKLANVVEESMPKALCLAFLKLS